MSNVKEFSEFNESQSEEQKEVLSKEDELKKASIQPLRMVYISDREYANIKKQVERTFNNEKKAYYKLGFELIPVELDTYSKFKKQLSEVFRYLNGPGYSLMYSDNLKAKVSNTYIYYLKPVVADKLNEIGLAYKRRMELQEEMFGSVVGNATYGNKEAFENIDKLNQ